MSDICGSLLNNPIFRGISLKELNSLLNQVDLEPHYHEKNQMIVNEGDFCRSITFIIEGEVFMTRHFLSGDTLIINRLGSNSSFGGALLFSDKKRFTYSVIAESNLTLLAISRETFEIMLKHSSTLSRNFISFLSDRIHFFNDKINLFTSKDVRSKLTIYLYHEMQKNNSPYFTLEHTREQIGNMISVTRPSVSRELQNMAKDGIIEIYRNDVKIIDLPIWWLSY